MKFRGKMFDKGSIDQFSRILSTVDRITKVVALRLTETHLYFIFFEPQGRINLWCELPQDHYFHEYNIEGVAQDCNEILLELNVANLVMAFKSAHTAKSVKVKLAQKYSACLSFIIELPSIRSTSRSVVHDVPVTVVGRKHWDAYQEPEMPQFDVSLYMPDLKVVRNVIERMKNISSYLFITAGNDGKFTLKVEADTVVVSTYFEHLDTTVQANDGQNKEGQDEQVETRVDIRKISQFLYGQNIKPDQVICNLVHHRLAQFFLVRDDVTIQFFLPNISL